jgi:hypothetical protein
MSSLEKAQEVLQTEVSSWGKRGAYPIMKEDMEILVAALAEVLVANRDNGDNTFFTQVRFDGLIFESSTAQQIQFPSTAIAK